VALDSGEGFIRVTGEVGTGKTMLCRMLLNNLRSTEHAVYLPNPNLMPTMLRVALARELGLKPGQRPDEGQLLARIQDRLIRMARGGKRVVVCLDEAQAMPDDTLEALRLLTNLETEKRKLLQIVLFGQPELDAKLAKPGLRQLRQRIAWSHELQPLDRDAVAAYVAHRLARAGYDGPELFPRRTIDSLAEASGGFPRLVNIIANKALMLAFGRGDHCIRRQDIVHAAADTDSARVPARRIGSGVLAATAVAALGLGVWALLTGAV